LGCHLFLAPPTLSRRVATPPHRQASIPRLPQRTTLAETRWWSIFQEEVSQIPPRAVWPHLRMHTPPARRSRATPAEGTLSLAPPFSSSAAFHTSHPTKFNANCSDSLSRTLVNKGKREGRGLGAFPLHGVEHLLCLGQELLKVCGGRLHG
jgi:hypothetical protein